MWEEKSNRMKNLVILTGAGISAESGLKTFRDMGGLWEEYDVTEVASPAAWESDPELVLRFYNERRKQLLNSEPNKAHYGLVALEKSYRVQIITQNVDDLHERAGSTNVLHLHGELRKAQSSMDSDLVYKMDGWELKIGDLCEKGFQLRPNVVWFGEAVPAIQQAIPSVQDADIFIIIGTSLNVYPAAGLINYIRPEIPVFIIDPKEVSAPSHKNYTFINEKASKGVEILQNMLNLSS